MLKKSDNPFEKTRKLLERKCYLQLVIPLMSINLTSLVGGLERNKSGDAVIFLGAAEEGLVSSAKLSGQEGVLVVRILLLTLTLTISSKWYTCDHANHSGIVWKENLINN